MGKKLTMIELMPGVNEQLETTITLEKEARSIIHGVVKDENNSPVKDAVVKLFEMPNNNDSANLISLFHSFTDQSGHFLFGPLTPGKRYVVKVWYNDVIIKKLPSTPCECKNHFQNQDHTDELEL